MNKQCPFLRAGAMSRAKLSDEYCSEIEDNGGRCLREKCMLWVPTHEAAHDGNCGLLNKGI